MFTRAVYELFNNYGPINLEEIEMAPKVIAMLGLKFMGFILFVIFFVGYFKNIYLLAQCDFEPSYKEEVLRGIGVALFPMGMIIGWMELED